MSNLTAVPTSAPQVVVLTLDQIRDIVLETIQHMGPTATTSSTEADADYLVDGAKAAQILGVTPNHFYLALQDVIPSVQVPALKRPRYRISDLRAYLRSLPRYHAAGQAAGDQDDSALVAQVAQYQARRNAKGGGRRNQDK